MEQLSEILKALSESTRLRILRLLDHGELCVCDLMAALDVPQSTVSRHMSFLKKTGWVSSRRKGKWVYYSLTAPNDVIQSSILAILREHLPVQVAAQQDYSRLLEYLETKDSTSCSSAA